MAFVIPTIYKAIDQMTGVQARIGASMNSLAIHAARVQRSFNQLSPSFSAQTKQMLSLAQGAVTAGAAIGGIAFSAKSLVDYEDAVQSFRTIVSDLNDTEFERFKKQIGEVATSTRKSTIDVAKSFETIAGLNAEFAKTAEGLGKVSSATITLAKASRMELAPAAESMVGIMNQFSFGVDQANRTINALAAGQAVGAANITQTAEALNNFGATAAGANVTLEQSVALIQTMAKFGQMGADSGHRLRSALIKIQQAGVGYNSGRFSLDEALGSLKSQYDQLGTAAEKDAYLTKVFGLEQITAGRILLSNIDTYKSFTKQVTGTNEAFKAAEINSNTLSTRIEELKNRWVTLITTSESVNAGLGMIGGVLSFVTKYMDVIVGLAVPVLGFFAAWKGYILAVNVVLKAQTVWMAANNFLLGVATVINGQYATSCFATIAGMNGMAFAAFFLEGSLLSLTVATGGVLTVFGLLVAAFGEGYDSTKNYNKAVDELEGGLKKIAKPIDNARIAQERFNKAMDEYNELQNFIAYQKYYEQLGGFTGFASAIKAKVFHPIMSRQAEFERYAPGYNAPQKSDFFLNQEDVNAVDTSYRGNSNINLKAAPIEVILKDQRGNIIGSNSANLIPSLSSTF